ncbi:metallophosphoesterase [Akkermansiaceae bacterium]|nr:metallophosphoesterase [Akkermansiaceae bacterium]
MKLLLLWLLPITVLAHDGPTPSIHYSFDKRFLKETSLIAQQGPDLPLDAGKIVPGNHGLAFTGTQPALAAPLDNLKPPAKTFTLTAWASIHQGTKYGNLLGIIEDNGGHEKGWMLGYNDSHFQVFLSTEKTDDGDGKIIALHSKQPYKKNTFYHLAATYDGEELALFINGKKDNSTTLPGGAILYPAKPRVTVAGYLDSDESHPFLGEIISAQVFEDVATEKWLSQEFLHNADFVNQKPQDVSAHQPLLSVVSPYLQFATTTGITVMWETSKPSTGILHYGETSECPQSLPPSRNKQIHEIRIENLKPGTQYFYRTTSDAKGVDAPQLLSSEVRTFQTDAGPGTPIAFAIISDTQGNPAVSGKLAQMAWAHRPNFLLHPGDLVSTGGNKSHWVEHYFKSMEPLISRVPFYSVLGNHEQNSANYYNYVSLPEPEYFYSYTYGDIRFFMIDTNKKCDPKSEQYLWLEKQLKASTSTWNILCHHHPAYTSDENDYGELWKTNQSTRGDLNARHLADLAHLHKVDIIWNGHIHSYERTWPLQGNRAVQKGTVHLITGGGGGGLETPGPFRTSFSNTVRHGHHYAMVWVNGTTLEYKAYDLEGRLFDTLTIQK